MNERIGGHDSPLTLGYAENSIDDNLPISGDKMTLIVAMKADKAIIMASDSRIVNAQTGHVDDNAEKMFPIGNFVLSVSGAGGIGLALLRLHHADIISANEPINQLANTITTKFSFSCYEWFAKLTPAQWPPITFLLAGYGPGIKSEQEATVYSFQSSSGFAPELAATKPVFGGYVGPAGYLCSKLYKSEISVADAIILSVKLVAETADSTVAVGGPIQIYEVTPNVPPRKLPVEEVARALAKRS